MGNSISDMAEKIQSQLRIFFIINIVVVIASFICVHILKHETQFDFVTLQRYTIVLTLAGIPGALKFFYWQYGKIKQTGNLNKYKSIFYLRLIILDIVYVVNAFGLFISGSDNFSFLSIITIFAMFLCMPNSEQVKTVLETDSNKDNQ